MKNQQLKHFAEQSGIVFPCIGEAYCEHLLDDALEQFAALVIQECVSVAREADSVNPFGAGIGFAIAADINEHFGIN